MLIVVDSTLAICGHLTHFLHYLKSVNGRNGGVKTTLLQASRLAGDCANGLSRVRAETKWHEKSKAASSAPHLVTGEECLSSGREDD